MTTVSDLNITTRRNLLRATSAAALLFLADFPAPAATDFWVKKAPSEWSPDEIRQLRAKSPWAKKVRGEIAGSGPSASTGASSGLDAAANSAPGSGGGRGGLNAAGMGDGGNVGGESRGGASGPARGGIEAPEVVIRWESAQPLLLATKSQLPPDLDNHYTISMSGLPPQMFLLALSRGGRGRSAAPPDAPDAAARQAVHQAVRQAVHQRDEIDTILSLTTLTVKGRAPQNADVMLRTTDAQTFLFGFSKSNPLAVADKEAVFSIKLGVLTIKTKFDLREMMFDGNLSV
jgi:hypothetical protein